MCYVFPDNSLTTITLTCARSTMTGDEITKKGHKAQPAGEVLTELSCISPKVDFKAFLY